MNRIGFLFLMFFSLGIVHSQAFIEEEEYFDLYKRHVNKDEETSTSRGWEIEKRKEQLSAIFSTLEITTPKEEIVKWTHKFQAIVNRKPEHSTLIIGCGNLPTISPEGGVHYIDYYSELGDQYRRAHAHLNADTWDPDFARNPTIVNAFGSTMIDDDVFDGHRYKVIVIEGIDLYHLQHTQEMLKFLLAQNGIVIYKYGPNTANVYNTIKVYDPQEPFFKIVRKGSHWEQYIKNSEGASFEMPLCSSMEEFMKKYGVAKEEICKDLDCAPECYEEQYKSDGWSNVEYYHLSSAFKNPLYEKWILDL